MAAEVTMPKMGYDMTEGTVLKWLKAEGDAVAKGDILAEIETGKVNIEMESFDEGVLRKILVGEGATVPVGALIAIIAGADEAITVPAAAAPQAPVPAPSSGASDPSASAQATPDLPPGIAEPQLGPGALPPPPTNGSVAPAATASSATSTTSAAPSTAASGRLRASPLARRIAADRHVDLASVAGSGPSGRITRDDVLAAAAQPAVAAAARPATKPAAADVREPLSRIRTTIAHRLAQSWQAAPHIFVTMAVEMDAALALRTQINAALAATGGGKVSVNDLVLKAAGKALRAHPLLNVSWDDGARVRHAGIHIGVAVSLDDGLITVTAPDVDVRPLGEIAADVAGKAARAREGKLTSDDMAVASTFTVSNLGMYGVESFTAIINPPEACILAVGGAIATPVARDGEVVIRQIMKCTLSADHRIVDGASAAAFLVTFKQLLEQPLGMLV
ncbi:MAG: dihydrolipoamide acetyltransferase family protein [Ardenticatenales bacterium]